MGSIQFLGWFRVPKKPEFGYDPTPSLILEESLSLSQLILLTHIIYGGLNNFVFWKCKKNLTFSKRLGNVMDRLSLLQESLSNNESNSNFSKRFLHRIIWCVLPWMFTFLVMCWWIEIRRSCNICPILDKNIKWNVKFTRKILWYDYFYKFVLSFN